MKNFAKRETSIKRRWYTYYYMQVIGLFAQKKNLQYAMPDANGLLVQKKP